MTKIILSCSQSWFTSTRSRSANTSSGQDTENDSSLPTAKLVRRSLHPRYCDLSAEWQRCLRQKCFFLDNDFAIGSNGQKQPSIYPRSTIISKFSANCDETEKETNSFATFWGWMQTSKPKEDCPLFAKAKSRAPRVSEQVKSTYSSMTTGPSLISSFSRKDQHFVLTICFFGL